MGEWISVKEQVPVVGEPVLTFSLDGVMVGLKGLTSWVRDIEEIDGIKIQEVTYWMPLPEPPKS